MAERVVLAMSGGVDSSAAAHLLLEQGYEVVGVFMRHGEESTTACEINGESPLLPIVQRKEHKQGCCSASDAEDARRVADRLGIAFYAINFQSEFREIIDYFVDEYVSGRTPNPCVMCNNWIKFGRLFDYADSVGAKFVATGHYARLSHDASGRPVLLRGVDSNKDQSYVLFGIDRKYLDRMLLPVGGYQKPEIREMAGQVGLETATKKDSQEICFVTSGHHGDFVRQRTDATKGPGKIVTTDGQVVGDHDGIENFTIGQRKGLGVAMGEPYFVTRIDAQERQVVIGRRASLERCLLTANRLNWLVDSPHGKLECQAQIRYNASPSDAVVEIIEEDRLQVEFHEPRHGVAPGQAVVVYDGDQVLGGGWIE